MCGIIGYTGDKDAKEILINGLKNLEYRGYDSSGIAFLIDNKINIYKETGKISNLEKLIDKKVITSNTAIGHTRWATHGVPNSINAHPHKVGSVTLVHNGIIENYLELKRLITQNNINLISDTDSEVACGYIYYIKLKNKNCSNLEILKKSCEDFRGSYAFEIIFDDEPDVIYTTRKDSPLIVGIGKSENFVASDLSAILEYTNSYILLNQNDFCIIKKDSVSIYDKDLNKYEPVIKIANFEANTYKKNGYKHFMLKEINEQPLLIQNIFKNYFEADKKLLENFDYNKYEKIKIVACGSAMHAGLVAKTYFEKYSNIEVDVEIASEFRYKNTIFNKDKTLIIIISQSGETADSLACLRMANEKSIDTLALTNVAYSSIAREAKYKLLTNAGPEIAVATTKGYTTQIAVIICLLFDFLKEKNMNLDLIEKTSTSYTNIKKILETVIKNSAKYKEIAKKIYKSDNIFFIGRGIDYDLCMEASLKLKEISYINSVAYPAGELKHGTISLVEKGTKIISIATQEDIFEKTIGNIQETKSRGADVTLITLDKFKNINNTLFENVLSLPYAEGILTPFIIAEAFQLISYEVALLNKCDIDKPRNLAKSVTVE